MTQQTESGLNVQFVNTNSGRHISLEQAINQIEQGNPQVTTDTILLQHRMALNLLGRTLIQK